MVWRLVGEGRSFRSQFATPKPTPTTPQMPTTTTAKMNFVMRPQPGLTIRTSFKVRFSPPGLR